MIVEKIFFEETHRFGQLFLDYINQEKKLEDFYGFFPTPDNFKHQATLKADFPAANRFLLQNALRKQYASMAISPFVSANIDQLTAPHTFTITTGHQLNLFTGPLYFIYKIATVINTAKKLRENFPAYNFVPVYWMASEDHDFEEINHLHWGSQKYTWQNTTQTGAVGHLSTDSLATLLDALPECPEVLRQAYLGQPTLAAATRYLVNTLFGNEGLVIVDGDDTDLKTVLKPIIKADVLEHTFEPIINTNTDRLKKAGYKPQIHAREINFFYMDAGVRERIVKEGSEFAVLNTDLRFSATEMAQLIEEQPQKFSPNVALRPIYQEMILPNLSYTGGPAEMAYWLQLKDMFGVLQVPFPILLPRNFAMVVNKAHARRIARLHVNIRHLFGDEKALKADYMAKNLPENTSLETEIAIIAAQFNTIRTKAAQLDPTLSKFVSALEAEVNKLMDKLSKRLVKAQEQKHDTLITQLLVLKEALFPNGGLQERHDNYLNFYTNNPDFIPQVLQALDPFDFRLHILTEA